MNKIKYFKVLLNNTDNVFLRKIFEKKLNYYLLTENITYL